MSRAELAARLQRIEQLLYDAPAEADREAAALLTEVPGQPLALLLQAIACRRLGEPGRAVAILEPLCSAWPDASAHLQLGLARREAGDNEGARAALSRATAINPDFNDAWRALAELLLAMGDNAEAARAFMAYVGCSGNDPRLVRPQQALAAGRTAEAEAMLRSHLERYPLDVVAMCMMAEVAARQDRLVDGERLLDRCLELVPAYQVARHARATLLGRQNRLSEALQECEKLRAEGYRERELEVLYAALLMRLGEYDRAMEAYRTLFEQDPANSRIWTSLGHALRIVGRRDECIDAYRKAIEHAPDHGEAWWDLANLKTFRFTDEEVEHMRGQAARADLRPEDRMHFCFALGKALADRGRYEEAFRSYAEGNRLRRSRLKYDPAEFSDHVRRSIELFTPAFFGKRAGSGVPDRDPIFIVGLPRSGSTLVEQILASHSAVEGTMELPDINEIARLCTDRGGAPGLRYPEVLGRLEEADLGDFGRLYLERTRAHRKLGRPFFTDKMPNNFAHIGLIALILPNARIIDVRREPMACGFAIFTQLFARGQHFAYSLEDIGRYYRDYVALMTHFDAVLPGRVHRVSYERLVQQPEEEVRRLLDHCGLPFEEACLRFYETQRPVSTPSSEQVRAPLSQEPLTYWRHFEPWLGPLKSALGPLAEAANEERRP